MKRLIVLGLAVLMVLTGVMTSRTQTCPTGIGWGEYGYCLQSNTCGTLPPFPWFQCAQVYCEGGAFGSARKPSPGDSSLHPSLAS
jgi:hypothetical protein